MSEQVLWFFVWFFFHLLGKTVFLLSVFDEVTLQQGVWSRSQEVLSI